MKSKPYVAAAAIFLSCAGPALADAPASGAGMKPGLLEALSHCAAIADAGTRLACYDKLAPQVKAALETPPPATAANAPEKPKAPTKEEQSSWFGFDMGELFGTSPSQQTTPQQFGSDTIKRPAPAPGKEAGEPQVLDHITAGVTDYSYGVFGKFIVFLDNGQVWQQLQGDSDHAYFRHKPTDNTVTISRGFLGSYNLSINDGNRIYKVTRLK